MFGVKDAGDDGDERSMCGSNKQPTGIKDFMMPAPPRSVCTNIHQCQMLGSTLGPVRGGSKISTTKWETGDAGSQRRDEEEENIVVESGASSGRRSDINKTPPGHGQLGGRRQRFASIASHPQSSHPISSSRVHVSRLSSTRPCHAPQAPTPKMRESGI